MAYLLDTDAASEAFAGKQRILQRIHQAPVRVFLSSIAAEEVLSGTIALINNNRNNTKLSAAHDLLTKLLYQMRGYSIRAYNDAAADLFASFSAQTKRVGSQDCRIAASAIAGNFVVVTANIQHFSQMPGVQIENWSR